LSTAQPGRRVIDAASDVERIADAVGLDRFGVLGISGGAPHALAAAAALPDRVSRCAAVVGSAPLRAPDLAFYDDMPAEIRDFWRRVDAQDVDALRRHWTEFLQWMQAGLAGLSLSRRVMDMLREAFEESARQGDEGYLEDWHAFSIPWGFNIRQVAVPTRLMFARDDTSVPVHHVAWFERHLPDARVDWVDGEHFGPRDEPEMALVAWAADRSPL
jgi:pimeloyl-ACP methyl ester carboxylesterase